MLAFFGTFWGHLVVQAVVGGAQIALNGLTGANLGPYGAIIQGVAALASEGLATLSSSVLTPGGSPATTTTGTKPTTVGR